MDHIVEEEAMAVYCFTKADLRRLYALLQFPSVWVCKNGSRFPGETAFILLFLRLRYVHNMYNSTAIITPAVFLLLLTSQSSSSAVICTIISLINNYLIF